MKDIFYSFVTGATLLAVVGCFAAGARAFGVTVEHSQAAIVWGMVVCLVTATGYVVRSIWRS